MNALRIYNSIDLQSVRHQPSISRLLGLRLDSTWDTSSVRGQRGNHPQLMELALVLEDTFLDNPSYVYHLQVLVFAVAEEVISLATR